MNETDETYPGCCEGFYSEEAEECVNCGIKEQCKEETELNEHNNDENTDDGAEGENE